MKGGEGGNFFGALKLRLFPNDSNEFDWSKNH